MSHSNSHHRFGIDLKLSEDYDIILKDSNDLMTTQDYENTKSNVKFDGYWSIIVALLNRLETLPGEHPFDPAYGSTLQLKVSAPMDSEFLNNISLTVQEALLQDGRVQSVESVSSELIANEIVVVRARVILIGGDSVSELVFPEMFIN